jgi:hypothetical protein
MSEAGTPANPDPLKAVADAMEAAVEAAKAGAADVRETAERALPVAGGMLSKFGYNVGYAVSYGVVFSAVFVARSVPQDNAVVHGLVDGARAAIDMVDEMKRGVPAEPPPESLTSEAGPEPGSGPDED